MRLKIFVFFASAMSLCINSVSFPKGNIIICLASENFDYAWIEEQVESNIVLNIDGSYSYKYDLSQDIWNQLGTADEMIEKTQISEDELKILTSQNLLDLILSYPLMCNLYSYDTYLDGYEHIKEDCGAVNELLGRCDAFDVILQKYKDYQIPTDKIMPYKDLIDKDNYVDSYNQIISDEKYYQLIMDDFYVYSSIDFLETMLLECVQENPELEHEFLSVYESKLIEKECSDYFCDIDRNQLLDLIYENPKDYISVTESINSFAATKYTTQNGSSLDYVYSTSGTYVAESQYSAQLVRYHASLVSIALSSFNCHSFAWLQDLYPDDFKYISLKSCSPFILDGSYIKRSTGIEGDVITWTGHSGIILYASKSNPYNNYIPEPYMISKWGTGPIVAHYQSLCDYAQGVVGYDCFYKAN